MNAPQESQYTKIFAEITTKKPAHQLIYCQTERRRKLQQSEWDTPAET